MKRLLIILTLLSLCFALPIGAEAQSTPRLVDEADVLTDSEEAELISVLDRISERQQYDVTIVIVESVGIKPISLYAADIYEENGYGYGDDISGTILLVSIKDREWYIASTGEGESVVTDVDYLADTFLGYLSDGDYFEAFTIYAEEMDYLITSSRSFPLGTYLFVALVAGIIVAFIVVQSMKSQLNSVKAQTYAREYVRKDSFRLNHSRDLFLYSTVTRVAKPKNNQNNRGFSSSSGRSFSGGGGKF